MTDYRTESDSLGSRKIPTNAYYGVQTVRALENFPISHTPICVYPHLINALAAIKSAAAQANHKLGLLNETKKNAIVQATNAIINGKWHDQFVVDVIQGGAGTSTNMNANEVIANVGLEALGHCKGDYQHLHPNNDINLSQSTNDVYPTACKLTIIAYAKPLIKALKDLMHAFFDKGTEFRDVLKMGRTQLQDAVPMTLGQEFTAFGNSLKTDIERLESTLDKVHYINMGATAIGTGINTVPGYSNEVCQILAQLTGLNLKLADDLVESTSDTSSFTAVSAVLKRIAIKLTKICNDLRLLSSGPLAGLKEITLPAVQPGSSIMPGKVNPVMPELLNQICFKIMGADSTIMMAASNGQLQLNAFEPIMLHELCQSFIHLTNGCQTFQKRCVQGIQAKTEHCHNTVMQSAGLITAFTPYIGYEAASEIAKEAQKGHKTVYQLISESGLLSQSLIQKILDPQLMTSPHDLYQSQ